MLGLVVKEKKKGKARQNQKPGLTTILKGIFTIDGWSEDKEKFKIELVNDIKDFLFTKWEKPWKPSLVFNESGKLLSGYRNINGRVYKNLANILSLERNSNRNPFFITISKLKELGGKIRNKDKLVSIVSYIPMWEDKEDKTPRQPDFVIPKFHRAINLEFVEGVKSPKFEIENFQKLELNQYVENFIQELKKRKRIPSVIYDQADSCHYKYARGTYKPESIHMVRIDTFKNIESYYSTLFHEITHSTKNPARLGRGKLSISQTLSYANEELVAELGAMILCEEMGLKYNRQNSLTYLKGWLAKTENLDTALLEAYSYASDAAEYLLKDIDLQKLVPESMVKRVKAEKAEQMELTFAGCFNEGLKKFIKKSFTGRFISCGKPSKILKDLGFENKEIILKPAMLAKKMKKHNLCFNDLEDLPSLIKTPLMVFNSKKFETSKVIITDRKTGEGLLCVVIRTDSEMNRLEVHEVTSIHGRNDIQLNMWRKTGLMIYDRNEKTVKGVIGSSLNCSKSNTLNGSSKTKVKKEVKTTKSTRLYLPNTKNTMALDKWKPSSHIKPLKGQLGELLGGYERKQFAIVIRGEKGAGKTRLLCQMINLFALEKLNGLFLSLEVSPESQLFGNYISYISKSARKHVAVSNQNTIKELESYCKKYDFIAVDSWGKLKDVSQEDFIRLIEKYPDVIWLCIFQSTTAGTARGGIMSEYDSSMVIQVAKGGLAQCEKNRYNSCDKVYNVFTRKLLKDENKKTN